MPDYAAAAKRHFSDAKHLHAEGRLPNADHLYGFAAECALKAIMLGLGMPMHPRKPDRPADPYGVHVNRLWDLFHSFVSGKSGAGYSDLIPVQNPFDGWNIDQRYESGVHVTEALLCIHESGSENAMNSLAMAESDGVV